jgi:hypothetical protein
MVRRLCLSLHIIGGSETFRFISVDALIYLAGRFGHFLYWIWPSFIEAKARAKYNF